MSGKKFQVWFFVFASVLLAVALPSSHSLASVSSDQASTPLILATPAPLSASTVAQARNVSYVYDAAGRLVWADYDDRRIIYVYDKAGNLLRQAVLELRRVYLPLVLERAP